MSRIVTGDFVEKTRAWGLFSSLSGDPPKFFVHFTDMVGDIRTQFKPSSEFETPLGVYGYPLMGSDGMAALSRFATNRKFVVFFTASSFANVIRSRYYTKESLDHDVDRILKVLPGNKKTKEQLLELGRMAGGRTPPEIIWNIARELVRHDSQKWRSFFMKVLGVEGWIDQHEEGIVHEKEPSQAVFFNPSILKTVGVFANPLGSTVPKPKSKEEALNYHYAPAEVKKQVQKEVGGLRPADYAGVISGRSSFTPAERQAKVFSVRLNLGADLSFIVFTEDVVYVCTYKGGRATQSQIVKGLSGMTTQVLRRTFESGVLKHLLPLLSSRSEHYIGVPQLLSINGKMPTFQYTVDSDAALDADELYMLYEEWGIPFARGERMLLEPIGGSRRRQYKGKFVSLYPGIVQIRVTIKEGTYGTPVYTLE